MKLVKLFLLFAVFFTIGCKGCSERDLLEQINNGNSDPEKLIIELSGTDIANAIESAYQCVQSRNFDAKLEIQVRTASLVGETLILDEDPYYEFDEDVSFTANTGFGGVNEYEIKVPETGAYGIVMEVELEECSRCCLGALDGQCGNDEQVFENGELMCKVGKPQVAIENTFLMETRPEFNVNLPVGQFINVRDCRSCDSCDMMPCEE